MTFQIRPAARTAANPLIGLYGVSGSGKTFSSLLLARGLVGRSGKIVLIDTESGRGELYADVIDGGYDVIRFDEPFTPDRYVEALKAAEQSRAGVIIIDSASHEWEGKGGVLEWAGTIEARTGKPGLHCWKDPKLAHQRFVLALLGGQTPVIICLRAKHKSRQIRNEKGKTAIVRDEHTSPIQAEDFVSEMTVHAEIEPDHTLRVTKVSHPALKAVFKTGEMISVETGRALAAWAKEGDVPPPKAPTDNTVLKAAHDVASLGVERFRQYWTMLSKHDRAIVQPHLEELKQAAEAADAQADQQDALAMETPE